MNREPSIELSSSDRTALCMIFINGRIAAVSRGSVSSRVKAGEHVRWFVRPKRRNAGFALKVSHRGEEQVLCEGPCDPVVTSGDYVQQKASRRTAAKQPAGETRARRQAPRASVPRQRTSAARAIATRRPHPADQ